MKALPGGNSAPQWDERLLEDIAFIKKNLRYPIIRNRILPVLFWSIFLGILALSYYMLYVYQHKQHSTPNPVNYILLLGNIVVYSVVIGRYLQSLRFVSIPTPFYMTDNMQVIQHFLKAQHLLVFRHPDAPEVFQILSRNLSTRRDEDREVIIFIADDKRILINSHFTNQGWSISSGTRHHKEMAKDLKTWIDQISKKPNSSIVPVNNF